MKSTGIVRKVDSLGRFIVPKELRTVLNVDIGDAFEIFTDGRNICLRKYNPGCIICGEMEEAELRQIGDKKICESCRKYLGRE